MFKLFSILLFILASLSADIDISTLTLEEKVGQLLMVHFNGEELNNDATILINELKVGGIIYYSWANGLTSPKQVARLSKDLQDLTKNNSASIPLLIAVDQEGGKVSRIQGLSLFPGNKALGGRDEPGLAKNCAAITGRELKAIGINLNLAPVIDVNSNPLNPVIGDRSFGASPELVCRLGKGALDGYHASGIMTCLKHFPGHGDVSTDSHLALPVVNKTREDLDRIELLPFAELCPYSDCVMTAHLLVPALDPHHCSTLSKTTLDILRNELQFNGVIISDSLVMEGLLSTCPSVDEAAIQAFIAGCDILLLGGKLIHGMQKDRELSIKDMTRIRKSLVEAVKNGRISDERLNLSVQRILKLKNSHD